MIIEIPKNVEVIEVVGLKEWLDEHDKQIREDVIDECIDTLNNSIPLVNNTDIVFGFKCAVERLEQLKEKKVKVQQDEKID